MNDYYEFPIELDMEKYTEEYQMKKDFREKNESQRSSVVGVKESEEDSIWLNLSLPKEYYQYRLKGVILHIGNADAGHYISLIRDNASNKWYEFNDSKVGEFNLARIPDECFGGQVEGSDLLFKTRNTKK